jgi:hypothetical protein
VLQVLIPLKAAVDADATESCFKALIGGDKK